jgi:putative colanic acid biosynthesis acetyltransferase WcaF
MLRMFGAKLDSTARVRPSCRITQPWNLEMGRKSALGDRVVIWASGPVRIGARTVVSQYCHLCAFRHDALAPEQMPEPAEITLGADVWVAADSVICGGVHIPDGVVVGARSVVTESRLEAWTIAAGQPARSLKPRPYEGPAEPPAAGS